MNQQWGYKYSKEAKKRAITRLFAIEANQPTKAINRKKAKQEWAKIQLL